MFFSSSIHAFAKATPTLLALAALVPVTLALSVGASAQGLLGQPVDVIFDETFAPGIPSITYDLGAQTISSPATAFLDNHFFPQFATILVSATQIELFPTDPDPNSGIGFSDSDFFTGYRLSEVGPAPFAFTSVSIDPATYLAQPNGDPETFGLDRVTFSASEVSINLESLNLRAGDKVVLDYTTNAPVPEASTTASFGLLLVLGLGGVIVAAKRRKAGSIA